MADVNDFVRTVKQAAKDAVEASAPTDVMTGTVITARPVTIKVEQRFDIGADQLIIPEYLTDRKVSVSVDSQTEKGGEPEHTHKMSGEKSVTIHNALRAGDHVILIRQSGGQKFLVFDKVGGVK